MESLHDVIMQKREKENDKGKQQQNSKSYN